MPAVVPRPVGVCAEDVRSNRPAETDVHVYSLGGAVEGDAAGAEVDALGIEAEVIVPDVEHKPVRPHGSVLARGGEYAAPHVNRAVRHGEFRSVRHGDAKPGVRAFARDQIAGKLHPGAGFDGQRLAARARKILGGELCAGCQRHIVVEGHGVCRKREGGAAQPQAACAVHRAPASRRHAIGKLDRAGGVHVVVGGERDGAVERVRCRRGGNDLADCERIRGVAARAGTVHRHGARAEEVQRTRREVGRHGNGERRVVREAEVVNRRKHGAAPVRGIADSRAIATAGPEAVLGLAANTHAVDCRRVVCGRAKRREQQPVGADRLHGDVLLVGRQLRVGRRGKLVVDEVVGNRTVRHRPERNLDGLAGVVSGPCHVVERHAIGAGSGNRNVLIRSRIPFAVSGLDEHRVLAHLKPGLKPGAERAAKADPTTIVDLPPRIAVVVKVGVGAPVGGDAEGTFLELAVRHQLFGREEAHVVVCGGLVGRGRAEELQAVGAGGEHGDGTGIGDERIGSGGESVQQIVLRDVRLVAADFPEVNLRRLAGEFVRSAFRARRVVERQRVEAGSLDRHVLIRKAVCAGVGLDEHRVRPYDAAVRHPCAPRRSDAARTDRPAGIVVARVSRIMGIGAGRS